ncbi:hypothetical protein FisN_4Hh408 [Fistulifera solaris]|uniref:Aminotransferase class V domain-containing protein n=1 Tax=Fistulifera solaris TaxID=1519565 RepID=A0A1Z5KQN4_FISSO|nr:hypothetical protein FisN_4Hh408 [Fistulifera solaris]|eukprot:GAX28402.1 hypothetical protein FisN_4Hh408 [Fistulifera solaris]
MKIEEDCVNNQSTETDNLILECGTSFAEREHRAESESGKNDRSSFESIEELRAHVANDVVTSQQRYTTFASPFEVVRDPAAPESRRFLEVPLVYADQTASNRPLQSIENYIQQTCLPLYGNTHTNTSITGSQSTAFVAEARQIVAEETNAKVTGKASLDVVLFAGNGATATVELLIDCLGLRHACQEQSTRPVVFIGPYEHHSNLVPWRETGCEIVMVPECSDATDIDFDALDRLLARPEYNGRFKMGTFSAASNITGKISDVDRIAATLHKHGALAFFDYATGASYMKMDMNPPPSEKYPLPGSTAKDAIFISPHKMIGGIGTPGVLIIKKHLVNQSNAPHRSGGGTVFYVTSEHHRFLGNRIERYEGGTPNVSGIIRTGLTFLTKRKIEKEYERLVSQNVNLPRTVEDLDCAEYERISTFLAQKAPNLVLLGKGTGSRHLPIFSFLIRFQGRFLHFNYVCAILNDVFGIQTRGGCMCSGPFAQSLLGLTYKNADGVDSPNEFNKEIEDALIKHKERAELLRPGFTRLSLPFKGLLDFEVEYILHALVWVAKHGWALMCQYRCNHRTGEWRHSNRQGKPLGREERKWLSHFDLKGDKEVRSIKDNTEEYTTLLRSTLANANTLLDVAMTDQRSISQALKMMDSEIMGKDDNMKLESLRWYAYPKECAMLLSSHRYDEAVQLEMPLLGAMKPNYMNKRRLSAKRDIEASFDPVSDSTSDPDLSAKKQKVVNIPDPSATEVNNAKAKVKKAPRDCSTWGKGEVVPVLANSQEQTCTSTSLCIGKESSVGNKKFQHIKPPAKMMRLINQAIVQWDMIKEGDKLLLGLSGGKDSLSLLHALLEVRRKHPVKFELEVCTIDPMTPSFDPSSLIPYVESLGLKYHYIRDDIVSRAGSSGKDGKMVCIASC